jgi:hypothetical protein
MRTLPKLKSGKNNNVTERNKYNDNIWKLNYCKSNEKMRYDNNDLQQLISTVHDNQKKISEHTKKISDQQKTIHRLLMPVDSQILSGTKTMTSTINEKTKISSTTATTTTTNITRITAPNCYMCRQKNVTDKNDQRLKNHTKCLSKCRPIENNTKRKRE